MTASQGPCSNRLWLIVMAEMIRMSRRPVDEVVRRANRSDISRRTGIHLSHVSRVLSGKRTPSSDNLQRLSAYLSVSMEELHQYLKVLRADVTARRSKSGKGRPNPPAA